MTVALALALPCLLLLPSLSAAVAVVTTRVVRFLASVVSMRVHRVMSVKNLNS